MTQAPMEKKFRLTDVILSVICVVFVAEAAAPVAVLGNSQFFWWIFLMIAFLLPYGLIAAELGTAYEGEGGLYDWVRNGLGNRWAGRVAWYYWINFPLWMASLAVIFPELLGMILGRELPLLAAILIELAFIWIVVLACSFPVSESVWILNTAAVIKVFLALTVGFLGLWAAVTRGVANPMTPGSFLPSFDLYSLSFISVIMFNFLGFEVITTYSASMKQPGKQIPQAIIAGGLVIAAIYIFSAFGIGAAIPTDEISTSSGLIDSLQLLTGQEGGLFISIMAILFLLTLFGNMISWSFGVNSVARYAAKNGHLPGVFGISEKRNQMPQGANFMNGIVASLVVIIAPLLPSEDLFWSFFSLNLVMFLFSYVPVFPAFLKLRKKDPQRPRPFMVKGGEGLLKVIAYVPMVLLLISVVFVAVPLSGEEVSEKLPVLLGTILAVLLGEVLTRRPRRKNRAG